MPNMERAMPAATAAPCQAGSFGPGHATIPRKTTLIVEMK